MWNIEVIRERCPEFSNGSLYAGAFVSHGDKENNVENRGTENLTFPTLSEDLEWEMTVQVAETSKRGQVISVRLYMCIYVCE